MERKHFEVATSSGKFRDLRKSLAMYSEVFVPGIRLDDQLIKRIYQQEIMSIAKPKNYMGMWQVYGLASVLKMNIFPAIRNEETLIYVRTCIDLLSQDPYR